MAETAKRVVTRILLGEFDGDLVDLSMAIGKRVLSGETSVKWRFSLDGVEATEDDLTMDEAFRWERLADVDWSELRPLKNAAMCRALLLVLLESRAGLSDDEAQERLKKWTLAQVVDACTTYEVVSPDPLELENA